MAQACVRQALLERSQSVVDARVTQGSVRCQEALIRTSGRYAFQQRSLSVVENPIPAENAVGTLWERLVGTLAFGRPGSVAGRISGAFGAPQNGGPW